MSDPYIDQFETIIYGGYARDQMKKVCVGRVPKLDGMVQFAVAEQAAVDAEMKAVLAKQPKPAAVESPAEVLAEARDILIRFGSYLNSLKGYPLPLSLFYRADRPSDVARRRLVKLAAAVKHIAEEIPKHDVISDPTWAKDFKSVSKKLEALKGAQLDAKVEKADLGPEVAAARERWLSVYTANKSLIRGLLGHCGKPDLLPLIFDDLSEVHRVEGVTDAAPPAADAPAPEPAAGEPAPA